MADTRSRPTAAQRDEARAALRAQVLRHAETEYAGLSRTLNCAKDECGPGNERTSCIGNRWISDTRIGCLCECHEPTSQKGN